MLSGGLPPILQTVAPSAQTAALIPGQTYAGVVRVQNGILLAQLGALQVPLPEGAALTAGQRISVLVLASGSTLQLEITALGATAQPAGEGPSIGSILQPILQALGKLELAPRAGSVLPQQLPPSTGTLQPLLAALFSERALGADLQQLQQVLLKVSGLGILTPENAIAVARWLEIGMGPDAAAAWRNLLDRGRAEQAATARIARALQAGGAPSGLASLKESAASLILRLLSDSRFMAWLRDGGESEGFEALAGRIRERAAGGELLNSRSLDQPYQFLELPVSARDGFLRAHIHSFSDDTGGGRRGERAVFRTILDLETTRLGPLWISLQATGDHCACRFRAADPAIADLLDTEANALRQSLGEIGYRDVSITAEHWDGNREAAVLDLLAPFQKLDLEG